MKHTKWLPAAAALAVAAIALTGCRGADTPAPAETDDGAGAAGSGIGITSEPCPDAVNPDNGCIYIGAISDLTTGPTAALAVPLTAGQEAFWHRVNEEGGVGGYDVSLDGFIKDAQYNPEIHNRVFQEMRGDILALTQTLGSTQTMSIIDALEEDGIVAVPAAGNSAWNFEPNILDSGANYCFEAMNGIDWAVANGFGGKVVAVHWPNDYGADAAYGAKVAAEANGLDFVDLDTPTGAENQAGSVAQILAENPAIVFVTTGPAELAALTGGLAQGGFQGVVLGSTPTWNVGLLQSPAAPALEALYYQIAPWGGWPTDSAAHAALRAAAEELGMSPNDGFTAGWLWSYPLLQALRNAAELPGGITRENVYEAATTMTEVDYEGALPPEAGNRVGDPNEIAFRASVVGKVDPSQPVGMTVIQDLTVGPTAAAFEFTEPCAALR